MSEPVDKVQKELYATLKQNTTIKKSNTEMKCLDENHMQFMRIMAKLFLSCWLTGQLFGGVAGGMLGARIGNNQSNALQQMILSFIKPVQTFVGGEKQIKLMIEFIKNPIKFCSILLGILSGVTIGGNIGMIASFILYVFYGPQLKKLMQWSPLKN